MHNLLRRPSRSSRVGLALAGVAVIVALSGCATASSASLKSDKDTAWEAWSTKWSDCMRAEGIDVKVGDGGFSVSVPQNTAGGSGESSENSPKSDPDTFNKADKACQDKVGEPPVRNAGKSDGKEFDAKFRTLAKCLRDAGYDMPDPTGTTISIPEEVDPADYASCEKKAGLNGSQP